jgi:hypothetical protein
MGADVPIAEKQQHAWYMTSNRGTLQEQVLRIRATILSCAQADHEWLVDWLVGWLEGCTNLQAY